MTPATPGFSCDARACRCFGNGAFDQEGRCGTCEHGAARHGDYHDTPIAAKLFLTGKTIDEAICLQCGGEISVASRITAGVTGQQTYAFGAVLSHLRTHDIDAQLSPVMLTEPLKPVAYFVFQKE